MLDSAGSDDLKAVGGVEAETARSTGPGDAAHDRAFVLEREEPMLSLRKIADLSDDPDPTRDAIRQRIPNQLRQARNTHGSVGALIGLVE